MQRTDSSPGSGALRAWHWVAGTALSAVSFAVTFLILMGADSVRSEPPWASFFDWPVADKFTAEVLSSVEGFPGAAATRVRPGVHDLVALAVPRRDGSAATWRMVRVAPEFGQSLIRPRAPSVALTRPWNALPAARAGLWSLYCAGAGTRAVKPAHSLYFSSIGRVGLQPGVGEAADVGSKSDPLDHEIATWLLRRWGADVAWPGAVGASEAVDFGPPDTEALWGVIHGLGVSVDADDVKLAIRLDDAMREVQGVTIDDRGEPFPTLRSVGLLCREQYAGEGWWTSHPVITFELARHDDAVKKRAERGNSATR